MSRARRRSTAGPSKTAERLEPRLIQHRQPAAVGAENSETFEFVADAADAGAGAVGGGGELLLAHRHGVAAVGSDVQVKKIGKADLGVIDALAFRVEAELAHDFCVVESQGIGKVGIFPHDGFQQVRFEWGDPGVGDALDGDDGGLIRFQAVQAEKTVFSQKGEQALAAVGIAGVDLQRTLVQIVHPFPGDALFADTAALGHQHGRRTVCQKERAVLHKIHMKEIAGIRFYFSGSSHGKTPF